ncbi:hypothetical protein HPB50_006943 [Hyalomma asiaticum]|uniref:Uncharacterized protein n=1 Tax=Hyalomma asiaticum TaxID=266040 RepID=A0ACB7T6E3_HYAAI|nr:hypothetical protein HPB50_006943 [Hyalomma asiaticum]
MARRLPWSTGFGGQGSCAGKPFMRNGSSVDSDSRPTPQLQKWQRWLEPARRFIDREGTPSPPGVRRGIRGHIQCCRVRIECADPSIGINAHSASTSASWSPFSRGWKRTSGVSGTRPQVLVAEAGVSPPTSTAGDKAEEHHGPALLEFAAWVAAWIQRKMAAAAPEVAQLRGTKASGRYVHFID